MKLSYTWEEVERWRDKVHRRSLRYAVKTKLETLRFINDVGFCFAFKSEHSELPCLWHAACGIRNPIMPRNTHSDPYLSFVWQMKNILPSEGKIFYGKIFKGRPTMVSMEYFPYFYSLSERTGTKDEYIGEFMRGSLSPIAKGIMDTLQDSSPQITRGLRLATGTHGKANRVGFEKAMTELQTKMYIVKAGEHHEPFTFEWAPISTFLPSLVRKARKISLETARKKILARYFQNQLIASVQSIYGLLGWKKQVIFETLGQLVEEGVTTPDVKVDGQDSKYYCLIR